MKVSNEGLLEILKHEGFKPYYYDDWNGKKMLVEGQKAVGFWTIGYGTLYREGMRSILPPLKPSTVITREKAISLARMDVKKAEDFVNSKLKRKISQNEFDALVSHAYNTGGSSNLMKLVNFGGTLKYGGKTYDLKSWWLGTYITNASTKKVMKGLLRRRREEWEMFTNGIEKKK